MKVEISGEQYWSLIRPNIVELITQGYHLEYYLSINGVLLSGKDYLLPLPWTEDISKITINESLDQLDNFDWIFSTDRTDKEASAQKRAFDYWEKLKNISGIRECLAHIKYAPFKPELPSKAVIYQARRRSIYSKVQAVTVWQKDGVLVCDIDKNVEGIPLTEVNPDYVWRENNRCLA
jgi:hypothetical protein